MLVSQIRTVSFSAHRLGPHGTEPHLRTARSWWWTPTAAPTLPGANQGVWAEAGLSLNEAQTPSTCPRYFCGWLQTLLLTPDAKAGCVTVSSMGSEAH